MYIGIGEAESTRFPNQRVQSPRCRTLDGKTVRLGGSDACCCASDLSDKNFIKDGGSGNSRGKRMCRMSVAGMGRACCTRREKNRIKPLKFSSLRARGPEDSGLREFFYPHAGLGSGPGGCTGVLRAEDPFSSVRGRTPERRWWI